MADKVLKSLTFPGLEDRYIVQGAIDDTLSVEGKAADAKATGDAIGLVDEKAKELSDANIINERRLDMLTVYENGGGSQLANLSGKAVTQVGQVYAYTNVQIDFSQNGKYFVNPVGKDVAVRGTKFYDENGNLLKFGGTYDTVTDWTTWTVFERVNDTTLKEIRYATAERFYSNNIYQTVIREFDGVISYAICGRIESPIEEQARFGIGITFDQWMRYYQPYDTNMAYSQDMLTGIFNDFADNGKFKSIPDNTLTPWMQSAFATTYNLLDERKIDWDSTGNDYAMKPGEYVPVQGGKTVMCNRGIGSFRTYDSSGNETSVGNFGKWSPIVIPADAVSCRFTLWKSTFPEGDKTPTVLYYDEMVYPLDGVDKLPVPMAQFNGWDINKNIYDYAIPELDSNIVRMMKTFAIREINRQRDAFRIGTFNIYINRVQTNRPIVKKELETYGIDMCCFQETQNTNGSQQMNIGEYLTGGWQFRYFNTNPAIVHPTSGQTIVSNYEIISSEEVMFEANNENAYVKCVIKMPRYKHYINGDTTLSLYTYHGTVTSDAIREQEVTQMLAAIATDTSDFIVVTGDTNDFSGSPNYRYDRWAQFEAAGLTPVHRGDSSTIEDDNVHMSIDNIFISDKIKCLYYNVIPSWQWMYTPPNAQAPVPVSDHDLVYADLQFDFEAALAARNT